MKPVRGLTRRLVVGAGLLAGAARAARAAAAPRRLGVISLQPMPPAQRQILESGLQAAGWPPGRQVELVYRDGQGTLPGLQEAARALAAERLVLVVASGSQPAVEMRRAAPKLPLVFFYVGDPLGTGLVDSLSRPIGLTTGFGGLGPELHAKMAQLAHECVPGARRAGILFNPEFPTHARFRAEAAQAFQALGLQVEPVALPGGGPAIGPAFAALAERRVQVAVVLAQPLLYDQGTAVARASQANGVPAVSGIDTHANDGVLMTYSWRVEDDLRLVPGYVDRILRGTPPGQLPVQQPTRFHLSIDLRAARSFGLNIAPALRLRADEVIE